MKNFSSGTQVSYKFFDRDNKCIFDRDSTACYANLRDNSHLNLSLVVLRNVTTKETHEYGTFYLEYIGEMLDLDFTITEDGACFEFKPFKSKVPNLVIVTLIRMLNEGAVLKNNLELFKLLKKGKCKYIDKFARYCYFYSKLSKNYMSTNHTIGCPSVIKMRTLEDFKRLCANNDKYTSVHDFFERVK